MCLRQLKVEHREFKLEGASKSVELTVVSSNHHVELNPSDAVSTLSTWSSCASRSSLACSHAGVREVGMPAAQGGGGVGLALAYAFVPRLGR